MVGVLKDALARQREVTLTYFSRSQGRLSRRVVRPYGIDEMVRTGKVALHRNSAAKSSESGETASSAAR